MDLTEEPSTSTITLTTPKASITGTAIAIILEELSLPYTLNLLPNSHSDSHTHHDSPFSFSSPTPTPPPPTTLTDTNRPNHDPPLQTLSSITTYLLSNYDKDNHHITYPPNTLEQAAVEEHCSKLEFWMGSTDPEPEHQQQQSPPVTTETGSNKHTTPIILTAHTLMDRPFRERLIDLYRLLELALNRQRWGEGSGWLAGEKCTVADLVHFPYVAAASQYEFNLRLLPWLRLWFERMKRRDGVRRGWEMVHPGEGE
ncbi:glutathione S-transferase [Aspergillus tubingensis]|uniref:glutathione S-transferase n=1 Tax=Aspergillus tubingensis TaxID=5068 RepID=UPI0015796E2F|nr:glutathione S-transferase [Aspergillus tubingensis]GFN11122.1 glutathione S-transferase [Aspergillus tubingensis]